MSGKIQGDKKENSPSKNTKIKLICVEAFKLANMVFLSCVLFD